MPKPVESLPQLKDASLLRQQGCIDGQWVDADTRLKTKRAAEAALS